MYLKKLKKRLTSKQGSKHWLRKTKNRFLSAYKVKKEAEEVQDYEDEEEEQKEEISDIHSKWEVIKSSVKFEV